MVSAAPGRPVRGKITTENTENTEMGMTKNQRLRHKRRLATLRIERRRANDRPDVENGRDYQIVGRRDDEIQDASHRHHLAREAAQIRWRLLC